MGKGREVSAQMYIYATAPLPSIAPSWATAYHSEGVSMERRKVTLRLNPEVLDLVYQVADALELSPASLIDCVLQDGLQRFADGELDLAGQLAFSERGRYKHQATLDLDGLRYAIGQRVDIT
jgi:hypothetical protein